MSLSCSDMMFLQSSEVAHSQDFSSISIPKMKILDSPAKLKKIYHFLSWTLECPALQKASWRQASTGSQHTQTNSSLQEPLPKICKISAISSLIRRNQVVSSSTTNRDAESKHLRMVFSANHYPSTFVRQASLKCALPTPTSEREKPLTSITIPYIQGLSEKIRHALAAHNIRTSFKVFGTLRQHLSRPKDTIDPPMRSGVVYSIPCANCNYTYIGETGCHLSTRIKQHRDAVRKGLTDRSAVAEHVWSLQHSISWDEVEILDQDPSTKSRRIKKALHIRQHSNLMNRDGGVEVSHVWDSLYSYTPLTQPSSSTSHFPAIVCSHSIPIILCLCIILAT